MTHWTTKEDIRARCWPTGLMERPTPREAWQAMLKADQEAFAAIGADAWADAEERACVAREAFSDALRRAAR